VNPIFFTVLHISGRLEGEGVKSTKGGKYLCFDKGLLINVKDTQTHSFVSTYVPASNLQRVAENRVFSIGKVQFWEWVTAKSSAPAFPSSAMTESTHVELISFRGDFCSGPAIIFEFQANRTILRDSPNVKGNKRSICASGSAEIDMPGTRGFITV
jgi:hypothetical protein